MFSLNKKLKKFIVLMLFTTILLCSVTTVLAQNHDDLTQRTHREEYADVDRQNWYDNVADVGGSIDIVHVGWSQFGDVYQGHIMIFTFDGSSLNVEEDMLFQVDGMNTVAHGVDMGDVDGDGVNEIAVTGYAFEDHQYSAWLQIYEWDGETLILVDTVVWTGFFYDQKWCFSYSVKIGDLNADGVNEIVTCGEIGVGEQTHSELIVWGFNPELFKMDDVTWNNGDGYWSSAESVALGSLNGEMKMVTGGSFYDASGKRWADLNVWSYGTEITFDASEFWEDVGNAAVYGVFVKNNKVYSAGALNDGSVTKGQLRKWGWGSLILEDSEEWFTDGDTEARDVFVTDVDYDGVDDVVTVGWANDTVNINAQLRTWSLDFTLKDSEEWFEIDSTRLLSVYVMNVNDDDEVEIITAGHIGDFLAKQSTVWSYPAPEEPEPPAPPPGGGIPGFPLEGMIVGLAVAALTLYLLRKRTVPRVPVTPSI